MYIDAFQRLKTVRSFSDGPIPIDKIFWYSLEIIGLDEEMSDVFADVISAMDDVYLEWVRKEHERESKKSSGSSARPKP